MTIKYLPIVFRNFKVWLNRHCDEVTGWPTEESGFQSGQGSGVRSSPKHSEFLGPTQLSVRCMESCPSWSIAGRVWS